MTIGSSHIYVDSYDFMKSRSIFIFLRRTLAVATLMAFFESSMLSQTVVVTDDATYTTGHVSSVLDVKSITKGFLIPRVTQVQRLSISSPANGLLVFQTDVTPGFYSYASGVWSLVGSSTADGSETKINAGTSIAVSGTGTTGNPYFISAQTQSVTQAQRASLTGLYAGRIIYCSDCGYLGKLQVYNGTAWTDLSGTTAILTTDATSDVKSTTATCGGNISSDGGYSITARGVCWSTTPNPTIYNDKTTNGSGTGSFSSSLTGLSPSTSYYVRAYATNSSGTSYGSNVSFTTTAYTVGDPCQGGIIAYITSDRILIAASSDQGSSIVWASSGSTTGATAQAIGTGDANTSTIYSSLGTGSSYAARVCKDLVLNGYSDWFLPSKDELYRLHLNRAAIGGFASANYWSSSESTSSNAWIQAFPGGTQTAVSKTGAASVRAIRELITVGYYYGGGRVAYLLQPGDPGYVAGELHGLIITAANVGSTVYWGCSGTLISGADGTALGTGNQNTTDIITGCSSTGIAAELCYNLSLNGFTDWYLPSRDEMYKIWLNRSSLGSFSTGYWTSTEASSTHATSFGWSSGSFATSYKDLESFYVRAVRSF